MDASHLRALWPTAYGGPWMEPAFEPGLVSVIVPTYERAGLICESLDSVFAQSYRPIELIIVDDGSTDGTPALVQAWSRGHAEDQDFEIRTLQQDHAGAPAARNVGLVRCRGEFIQFLDSDDLLHSEKIERQVARLMRDKRLDVTYAHAAYFTVTADWSAEPYDRFPKAGEQPLTAFLLGNCWLAQCALFRRRACHAIGPWDEQAPILEDWDYAIRLILGGACLDFSEGTLLLYRQSHDVRPTVTSRQNSRRSLSGRYVLTLRWLEWIRAAGQLDQDVQREFSSQLFELAKRCLMAREVDLAREVFESLSHLDLAAERSRSQPMYVFVANLPDWCSPVLAYGLQRTIELKNRAGVWLSVPRRRGETPADR